MSGESALMGQIDHSFVCYQVYTSFKKRDANGFAVTRDPSDCGSTRESFFLVVGAFSRLQLRENGLWSREWSEPGRVCHTRFWQHPGALHPPSLFTCDFVWGAQPRAQTRKTRSCGLRRHGQPAPIAHPRCRRAPGIPGGEPARWGGHPRRLSP